IVTQACTLVTNKELGAFLEVQLLDTEQLFVGTLMSSFLERKQVVVEYENHIMISRVAFALWREISSQELFVSQWEKLKKEVDVKEDILLTHPYWKELFLSETKQLHE